MKKNLLPIFLLSIFAITNCTSSNVSEISVNNSNTQIIETQNKSVKVEDSVSKERMQENVAIFSGAKTFGENQKIEERGSKTGRTLTRTFLKSALKNIGLQAEEHLYQTGFNNGANVFAKLMATETTDEYILVGAHMDSVTNPGADDNAGGSTAILEAATILSEMPTRKLNIIFAWFDQEELGLVGSKQLAADFKKNNMKLNSVHIVDMLGWDKDGDKTVEIARPQGFLWDYYKMVNEKHNLNLPLFRTSLDRSDHYSFETKGYNSILLIEEYVNQDFNQYYHKKTDTMDKINFDYLATGTKLLVAAVSDLTLKVPAPANIKIIPHENFPTRKGFCSDNGENEEHFHH